MHKFLNPFSKKQIPKEKIKIIVDNREKNSLVISNLIKIGFEIEFKQLPIADYIINDTAIERKTISDFKSSIINKRLISQIQEIKKYPKHFIILEGLETTDPYSGRIHENAFRGFLLSIALEYKVPIIFTLNEEDTVKYLYVLAKKQKKNEFSLRPSKTFLSEKEQLQFILEGFPGIGPITSKKLLKKFKTIKGLANSSKEELQEIIGKKAEKFYELINKKW